MTKSNTIGNAPVQTGRGLGFGWQLLLALYSQHADLLNPDNNLPFFRIPATFFYFFGQTSQDHGPPAGKMGT
jgi:hypothetical protein